MYRSTSSETVTRKKSIEKSYLDHRPHSSSFSHIHRIFVSGKVSGPRRPTLWPPLSPFYSAGRIAAVGSLITHPLSSSAPSPPVLNSNISHGRTGAQRPVRQPQTLTTGHLSSDHIATTFSNHTFLFSDSPHTPTTDSHQRFCFLTDLYFSRRFFFKKVSVCTQNHDHHPKFLSSYR